MGTVFAFMNIEVEHFTARLFGTSTIVGQRCQMFYGEGSREDDQKLLH